MDRWRKSSAPSCDKLLRTAAVRVVLADACVVGSAVAMASTDMDSRSSYLGWVVLGEVGLTDTEAERPVSDTPGTPNELLRPRNESILNV